MEKVKNSTKENESIFGIQHAGAGKRFMEESCVLFCFMNSDWSGESVLSSQVNELKINFVQNLEKHVPNRVVDTVYNFLLCMLYITFGQLI